MAIEFVICGLEHSGTTLISDLFRQVPHVDAGFEAGVLLVDQPGEFLSLEPFSRNILAGWGITQDQFEHCCAAPSHEEFYERLEAASTVIAPGTRTIFDKTPRYLSQLRQCMTRCPLPFIASYKDPRATVYSDYKRANGQDFDSWYDAYMRPKRRYLSNCYAQCQDARAGGNDRVAFVALEELALDARNSMDRLFAHVGQTFSLDYVIMRGLRYQNTRSNTVSIDIAFEYLAGFTPAQISRIEQDFAELERWFYN